MKISYNGSDHTCTPGSTIEVTVNAGSTFEYVVYANEVDRNEYYTFDSWYDVNAEVKDIIETKYTTEYYGSGVYPSKVTAKITSEYNCTVEGAIMMSITYDNRNEEKPLSKTFKTANPVKLKITFTNGKELFPEEPERLSVTFSPTLTLTIPDKYENSDKYTVKWIKDGGVVSKNQSMSAADVATHGIGTYKAEVTRIADSACIGGSGTVIEYIVSPQYVSMSIGTMPQMVYGTRLGYFLPKSTQNGTLKVANKTYDLEANVTREILVTDLVPEGQSVGIHTLDYEFAPQYPYVQIFSTYQRPDLKYEVTPKSIEDMTLEISQENFTYNGEKQVPDVTLKDGSLTLTQGTDYTVTYENSNEDTIESPETADTYKIIVKGKGNYAGTLATETFEINPVSLSLNSVTAKDRDYDGTTTVTIETLLLNNIFDDIDSVFDLSDAKANVSTKNPGTLSGVCGEDEAILNIVEAQANYDTKNVGVNIPVRFEGFKLEGEEANNYSLKQPVPQTASITKRPLGMVEGSANVKDKLYDGTTNAEFVGDPTLLESDIAPGDAVKIESNNAPEFNKNGSPDTENEIEVTTNLTISGADAANYDFQIPIVKAWIKNYFAEKDKEYSVHPKEGWTNNEFVIKAGEKCYLADTLDGQWKNEIKITCEAGKSAVGTKSFYVKITDSKGDVIAISKKVNEDYKIDKSAPTGTVKFTDYESTWTNFIEDITFGLFYKDAQEVVITAEDQENLSGVASVEWYESLDKGMTLEEVQAITNWKKYDGRLIVALEDTKNFVYYVKITDNARNITYLSTDGAVYDITNPAITGIVNGETYYTTQVVNVSDANLKEVTLNGTSLTIIDGKIDPITLEGNKDATYIVVATDKAGNKTTVSITMKPVTDLVADITDSNVALEDEKELKEAEKLLEEALKAENIPNLKDGEAEKIIEKLSVVKGLLQELYEVKDVIKMLENLPDAYLEDGETVNPYVSDRMDDEEEKLYSAVQAAYKAYNKLSAHQQSLISTSLKHNVSNLRKILTDYRITDGDGKVWVYNTNGTLTFTANGPVCRFENALVDGKKVPAEEMKVTKGSTVVELDAGYLHRLGTGDSANILLWGAALAVGAAGMVVAKKRRKGEEA